MSSQKEGKSVLPFTSAKLMGQNKILCALTFETFAWCTGPGWPTHSNIHLLPLRKRCTASLVRVRARK